MHVYKMHVVCKALYQDIVVQQLVAEANYSRAKMDAAGIAPPHHHELEVHVAILVAHYQVILCNSPHAAVTCCRQQ